jgi:hypothetical protein
MPIITSLRKSFEISPVIVEVEAPNTFPYPYFFCSVYYGKCRKAKQTKDRQEKWKYAAGPSNNLAPSRFLIDRSGLNFHRENYISRILWCNFFP